ncbi:MAG: GNAT family N-acetyltransferase [Candidatus Binatia bacterium]
MAFNNDDFQAPEKLRTDEFLLRPIRASDAELDYEAVMESKEFLRQWEQSSWPEDDFTMEANREDLDKLARRHTDGESFTYTVMNPTETQCLGCVYIFPTAARLFSRARISEIDGASWSAFEAAVYFWIRKSRLADELDRRLLDALGPWLEHDWRIEHHLIVTNEQFEQQVAMIEGANLQLRFQLTFPNEPGTSLAYA